MLLKRGFDSALVAQQRLRRTPVTTLFVLAHARSGSSLLVHLLNESPEIRATGENWICYDGEACLQELLLRVHAALRDPLLGERYVVDKILYDHLIARRELLQLSTLRAIFLVREPERTLLGLFANRERLKFCPDWPSAVDYYTARLERLAADAELIGDPRRSFFCTHRQLVEESERCLAALTSFLGLETPLSPRYRIGRYTGVAGLGDFSPNIRAGRIIKTAAPADLEVPASILARGREAYERCCARLAVACTSLPGSADEPRT